MLHRLTLVIIIALRVMHNQHVATSLQSIRYPFEQKECQRDAAGEVIPENDKGTAQIAVETTAQADVGLSLAAIKDAGEAVANRVMNRRSLSLRGVTPSGLENEDGDVSLR